MSGDEFAALAAARTDGELETARQHLLDAYKQRVLTVYRQRRRELHRKSKGKQGTEEQTLQSETLSSAEPPEAEETKPMQGAPA
ncbi:MAG TPA: hypothetical protein VEY12_04360 [Thermoplasmata archaeon]|nr:hypothetical protein [Thermoplasmata archaeon]